MNSLLHYVLTIFQDILIPLSDKPQSKHKSSSRRTAGEFDVSPTLVRVSLAGLSHAPPLYAAAPPLAVVSRLPNAATDQ